MSDATWWVVKSKSKAEKKLAQLLNDSGWKACCPTYTTVRQWSDRKKKVELPLISCVVFVNSSFSPRPFQELYQYPHVVSILREYGKPALVRDRELQNLLILCAQWEDDLISRENYDQYESGDFVEVTSGKFQGLKGEMIKIQGRHKILLSIETLKMSFSVVIPKSQVKLISKRKTSGVSILEKTTL
jgi:transcription antitermination factor NusG